LNYDNKNNIPKSLWTAKGFNNANN